MAKSRGRKFAEITSPSSGVFDLTSVPTITNAKLQNSAMTLAGSSVSLGGTGVADTDALSEGSSNLYFTDARVQTFLGGGTLAGNVVVPDNRSIYLGSDSDFRMVHNTTNTQLINATGALQVTSNGGFDVTGAATFSADLTVDTSTLKVDSSNNRVGIGTASPATPLHTIGITTFDGDGSSRAEITSSTASSIVSLDVGGFNGTPTLARDIRFLTNAASNAKTERMRISSAGHLLPASDSAYNIGANATRFANAYFDTMYGTVGTAAQPNITSVGTLTGLTTSGTINVDTIQNASGNLSILSTQSILIKFDSDNDQTNRELNIQNNAGTQILKITEAATATFSGTILVPDGSASAPAIGFGNDTDTGILRVTTNALGIAAGGSRKFYVNATNAYFQNLTQVQIDSGTFMVDVGAPSSTDQTLSTFQSQSSRKIGFVWDDSASTLGVATLTSHPLAFHTGGNSSEKMRITTAGDVSIGSDHSGFSGWRVLNVRGESTGGMLNFENSSGTRSYTLANQGSGARFQAHISGGYHRFETNAESYALYINNTGDIGVGTSSPFGATTNRRCFSVNGTSSTSLNIGVGGAQKGYLYSDGNLTQVGSIGNIPLKFASDDTPRMMLLGTGQFAVNDTGTSAHQMKVTSSTMGLRIKSGSGGYSALTWSGDGENTIGSITTTTNQILIGSQNSGGTGSNAELLIEPRSGSNKRVLTLKSTGNIHGPINGGPLSFAGLGCFNIMDMEREWLDLIAANSGSEVTSHTSTGNVQGPSMSHPGSSSNGYSRIKYADHPTGGAGVVLESVSGSSSTWNGGWNSSTFTVDRHKPYLYTCYVRRTSSASAGTFYFGLYNAYPQGTSTTVNTNPYMVITSAGSLVQHVWHLVYCMVYPREYNGTGVNSQNPGDMRGLWRIDNMDRRAGQTGWRHYQDSQQMRSYLYYAGDSATTLQWARPGVWVMDGNQPTFGDLINAHGISELNEDS